MDNLSRLFLSHLMSTGLLKSQGYCPLTRRMHLQMGVNGCVCLFSVLPSCPSLCRQRAAQLPLQVLSQPGSKDCQLDLRGDCLGSEKRSNQSDQSGSLDLFDSTVGELLSQVLQSGNFVFICKRGLLQAILNKYLKAISAHI